MKNKILGIIGVSLVLAIAACASMSIVNVEWDTLKGPEKVRQYMSISTTEVSVYANYKDESRKEVVMFSTSHDKDKTGIQTVTVSILNQGTGTFQTEVMELLSIRVDRPPTKTTYTVGEKADLAGIKVMGSWKDFPDAEVPSYQVSVSRFDSGSAGTNRLVTVDYKGKTATFPVTVTAAATPAPAAPAASQPSQPAQQQPSTQQPTQPSTQQPPAQSTFNPAANQPSPVGTWNLNGTGYYTFNANGTGTVYPDTPITWTASGNRLTVNILINGRIFSTQNSLYSITGNTLTSQAINNDGTVTGNPIVTFTKQ